MGSCSIRDPLSSLTREVCTTVVQPAIDGTVAAHVAHACMWHDHHAAAKIAHTVTG